MSKKPPTSADLAIIHSDENPVRHPSGAAYAGISGVKLRVQQELIRTLNTELVSEGFFLSGYRTMDPAPRSQPQPLKSIFIVPPLPEPTEVLDPLTDSERAALDATALPSPYVVPATTGKRNGHMSLAAQQARHREHGPDMLAELQYAHTYARAGKTYREGGQPSQSAQAIIKGQELNLEYMKLFAVKAAKSAKLVEARIAKLPDGPERHKIQLQRKLFGKGALGAVEAYIDAHKLAYATMLRNEAAAVGVGKAPKLSKGHSVAVANELHAFHEAQWGRWWDFLPSVVRYPWLAGIILYELAGYAQTCALVEHRLAIRRLYGHGKFHASSVQRYDKTKMLYHVAAIGMRPWLADVESKSSEKHTVVIQLMHNRLNVVGLKVDFARATRAYVDGDTDHLEFTDATCRAFKTAKAVRRSRRFARGMVGTRHELVMQALGEYLGRSMKSLVVPGDKSSRRLAARVLRSEGAQAYSVALETMDLLADPLRLTQLVMAHILCEVGGYPVPSLRELGALREAQAVENAKTPRDWREAFKDNVQTMMIEKRLNVPERTLGGVQAGKGAGRYRGVR